MGYASYSEDILDARSESKIPKIRRRKKVSNKREPPKKQSVPEDDICFESLLNNLPVPDPPPLTPKGDINALGESKRSKTLRSKTSPKTRQRSSRGEPRQKHGVSVEKTRYVTPCEIQRRIQREIYRQQKEDSVHWN